MMSPSGRKATPRLLDFVARQLHLLGHRGGLYPIQWTLLRYLAEMPDEQRTASAMARYHHYTLGAVTRSVRSLIAKGLVSAGAGVRHHRSLLLTLTDAGRAVLNDDPLHLLERAAEGMTDEEHRVLIALLTRLLATIQHDDAGDGSAPGDMPKLDPG